MEMMYALHMDSPAQSRSHWLGSLLLFPLCVYFCVKGGAPTILDTASTMVYEAGGYLFGHFGELGLYAGGPVLQILLPCLLIFLFYFLYQFCFGVQVFLFWLGQNLIHISLYIRDAQAGEQVLLDEVGTGWQYLLDHLYLLEYSALIGFGFYMLAALCFFTLLVLPRYMSR